MSDFILYRLTLAILVSLSVQVLTAAEPLPTLGIVQPAYDPAAPTMPVRYTDEEKQAQRNAGRALVKEFQVAAREGRKVFNVPKGIYRLDGKRLALDKLSGFTLDWGGSEVILESAGNNQFRRHFMEFYQCRETTVKNLTVDADPPGILAAELLGFDAKARTLDVKMLDCVAPLAQRGRIMLFGRDGKWLRSPMIDRESVEDLGGGRYRIKLGYDPRVFTPPGDELPALQKGILLAIDNDQPALFGAQFCSGLRLENITSYAGKLFVWERDETGSNTFVRLRSLRRPGTNRLMGGGMCQVAYQLGGPTFEDCEFDAGFDDTINVLSTFAMVYEHTSGNEFIVQPRWKAFDAGSMLRFYEYGNLAFLAEGKVVSLESIKDKAVIEASKKMAKEKPMAGFDPTPWRVVLDREIQNVGKYAFVMSSDHRPTGVTIRKCHFKNVQTRPILINGCADALIEGNVIEDCGGPGIQVSFEIWFMEGPFPERIKIRNNVIRNSNQSYHFDEEWKTLFGGIFIGGDMALQTSEKRLSEITIENNFIENPGYCGVLVYCARDVNIIQNTIINPVARIPLVFKDGKRPGEKFYDAFPGGGMFITSAAGVRIENNTVELGPNSGEAVHLGRWTERIEELNNKAVPRGNN